MFSRRNCSLCDAFESELDDFLQKMTLTLEKKDVDSQASLKTLYGNDVPVLTMNDQIICQHFFDKDKILKALS